MEDTKNYTILKLSNCWSTDILRADVERLLNNKIKEGYEIVAVAFGVNLWWMPTAFVTLKK